MARRYLISGRVQGVGFRYFTRGEARELGLSGWVRNLADGRVEAVALGSERQVARFSDRLRQGPPGSLVHRLDESSPVTPPTHEGFEIRYDPA